MFTFSSNLEGWKRWSLWRNGRKLAESPLFYESYEIAKQIITDGFGVKPRLAKVANTLIISTIENGKEIYGSLEDYNYMKR